MNNDSSRVQPGPGGQLVTDATAITLSLDSTTMGDRTFHVLAGVVPASSVWRSLVETDLDVMPSHVAVDVAPSVDAIETGTEAWAPEPLPPPDPTADVVHANEVVVSVPSDDVDSVDGRPSDAEIVTPFCPVSVTEPPVPPQQTAASAPGLIDGVPPSFTAAHVQDDDHDGYTIPKAEMARVRREVASISGSAMVRAIVCASGHANPPNLAYCRSCGAQLVGLAATAMARPVLGVLRFSNGLTVPVDRPQIIGRSPKIEGQVEGELPNLVKLDDAGQGLSRRHAALHIEGWDLLIEDLGSANDTIVTVHGYPQRRLTPGEPALLELGASVDLGGEISFTYEATG